MGFLRKEWDWENPAEQANLETHEAYRTEESAGKEKKTWLWVLTILCGALSCFLLYHIKYTMYGGILETNWATYLGVAIGTVIGLAIRSEKEVKKLSPKVEKILNFGLTAVLLVFIWWFYFQEESRYLEGVQTLCLFPLLIAIDKMNTVEGVDKKAVAAWNIMLTFAILAAVTFVAPRVLGYVTTADAEKIAASQGCADVEYLGRLQGRWVYQFAEDNTFYQEEMEKDWFYMVYGEKDNEDWRFIIDPKGGEVVLAGSETEEPGLAEWYRREEIEVYMDSGDDIKEGRLVIDPKEGTVLLPAVEAGEE